MEILLWLLGAIIIAGLILYFAFPRIIYGYFQRAIRRKGGLVQKSVRVGKYDWPYLEGGAPDAPVMLLIHGFGGEKDNWSIYAPNVVGKYRIIAPDLPGFGENDRSPDREYDISRQVGRVKDFCDALDIKKCHIGGNSMGGFIALQFALEHPEYCDSLTLFNNAGVVGADKSDLQIEAEAGKNPLAINSAQDVARLMEYVAYKPVPVPGQFRKIFFEDANAHKELLDRIFWSIAEDGLNNPLNDRLGNLKVPTLIIWGRHDQLIDVSCALALNEGIENSELFILEDAGHIPMIEKPKETAQRQLAFLAKV